MPYWGTKSIDNDFAFNEVCAIIFLIKDRLFKQATSVTTDSFPEQAIVASVQCIRLLAEEFPKCVSVHFRRKDFERAKLAFYAWFDAAKDQLPSNVKDAIATEAEMEFALFESRVLS